MGFRQFLLRGIDLVRGEWSLVTMAWNVKQPTSLELGGLNTLWPECKTTQKSHAKVGFPRGRRSGISAV
jgi:hypothetical protein